MNSSSTPQAQAVNSPPITLVITPYHIHGPPTWTYPEPLLDILGEIVLCYSIPGTSYQSAFYQDVDHPSRFYHLQTSPPEPSYGWLAWVSLTKQAEASVVGPSATSVIKNNTNSILPTTHPTVPQQKSLAEHLQLLSAHATPSSSNGTITLGLPTRRRTPISLSIPPFNAPLILIGTRNIASSSAAAARAGLEEEIKDQLVQFRRYTGAFDVAAGWREMGYYRAEADADACTSSSSRRTDHDSAQEDGEHKGDGVLHRAVRAEEGNSVTAAAATTTTTTTTTITNTGNGSGGGVRSNKQQFVTLSGWTSVEDYAQFMKLMAMAVERGGSGEGDRSALAAKSAAGVGRISPDVAGQDFIWARRIA